MIDVRDRDHIVFDYIWDHRFRPGREDGIMKLLADLPIWKPSGPHDLHCHTGYITVQTRDLLYFLHKLGLRP